MLMPIKFHVIFLSDLVVSGGEGAGRRKGERGSEREREGEGQRPVEGSCWSFRISK